MWWREVNDWGAAVGRQAGWRDGGSGRRPREVAPPPGARRRCHRAHFAVQSPPAPCKPCPLFSFFIICSSCSLPSLLPLVSFLSCLCTPPPPLAHPLPAHTPHHPVARIMTPLTTPTHGGSSSGPARKLPVSNINHITGTSLQFRGRGGCSAVCRLRVDCIPRYAPRPSHHTGCIL